MLCRRKQTLEIQNTVSKEQLVISTRHILRFVDLNDKSVLRPETIILLPPSFTGTVCPSQQFMIQELTSLILTSQTRCGSSKLLRLKIPGVVIHQMTLIRAFLPTAKSN